MYFPLFVPAALQVSISLNKVELSVGESKFFICTGMKLFLLCMYVGVFGNKALEVGVSAFICPYGEWPMEGMQHSAHPSSTLLSSLNGASAPEARWGGSTLWLARPTSCWPPLLSCQPAQCATKEESRSAVWKEGGEGASRNLGGKNGGEWTRIGRNWKAKVDAVTGKRLRNWKGFEAKESWRWEISSRHAVKVHGRKRLCHTLLSFALLLPPQADSLSLVLPYSHTFLLTGVG